ncbi:MAG: RNA 3'-terminal phosphate cyclase [Candidatus Woesearchaeota archaeon]|nr:RNA 3'-terminal phosphate cyclase [Candidatus Woesearchaeota archaeon]
MELIKIDGDYKEGGGQIIRTALALSALTQKPFEIDNVRKGRKEPGLKSQHLYCIKAAQELCSAEVEGAELGSDQIKFIPGRLKNKNKTLSIDIGTAGSITLFLQSVMLPCMLAEGKANISVKGGTDVKWSMPVDYFSEILLPQLRRYSDIDFKLNKRGYYPKGNGMIEIKISPKFNIERIKDKVEEAPKIELVEQGNLMQIKGISHCSASLESAKVAERQSQSAQYALKKMGIEEDVSVNIRTEICETLSDGSGITLWAIFSKDKDDIDSRNPIRIGSDSLGERGKKAEEVGKEAAERLLKEISHGAPVDEYLADNLIPFLGLFGGKIKVAKISDHTLTNIYVVEKFLDVKFEINEENKMISVKVLQGI